MSAEVFHALGGAGAVATLDRVLAVTGDVEQWPAFAARRCLRRSDCPDCGAAAARDHGGLGVTGALAWDYEQEIEVPPPIWHTPAAARRPADPVVSALPWQQRGLPTSPRVGAKALPGAHPLRAITRLLASTVGTKLHDDGRRRRAAPSGGNLGSVQAFVISRAEIPSLESHCAWYDNHQHQLVATGRVGPSEVTSALAGLVDDRDWEHIVVFVADIAKVARKYGDFALRLVHLDAGVAVTQALLAAHALDLTACLLTRWEARAFADLLDLNPADELVTGVFVLPGGYDE